MAYADQEMSGNKIATIVIVAILHVIVGYALVTGLAYDAVQKVKETMTTFDVKEEEPPPEEPPPPPEPVEAPPPPIVAPPPPIKFNTPPPAVQTVNTPPPTKTITFTAPPAPPPPAPPPPPKFTPKAAEPRGNPGSWATPDDYPSRALREDREGTTGFTVTIDTSGRITGCTVTRSSGHADLDEATCKYITRRGRFRPATDGNGAETTGSWSSAVRWQIPK
jgi:periplasmic protein TonB